jgi:hypothetical protein
MERTIANRKHNSKPATRLDLDGNTLNKAIENENCGSKGYRTAESIDVFLAFSCCLVERQKLSRRPTIIPHRQPEILYNMMRDSILIFWEVEVSWLMEISTLMKKALNIMNAPLQSLSHRSVGYQSMHTQIDLAKMAYLRKCNRECMQE